MNRKLKFVFSGLVKINIFLIFLFARSFTGLTIFNYRVGEYLVASTLFLLLAYSVLVPLLKKKYFLDSKPINFAILALIFSFFLRILFSGISINNEMIYKTSSYIWTFGALAIGYYVLNENNFQIRSEDTYLAFLGFVTIYIFSTRGISVNRQNLILNYTDKFEYPKGSDILLAFIFIFYIFLNRKGFSQSSLCVFILFSSLFAPLFMVKSRSAFISLAIFALLLTPYFIANINSLNKYFYICAVGSLIIFILSTSWVVSRDIKIDEEISNDLKFAITSRYNTINDNPYEKEVLQLTLFYFEDGRIFSSDGNLNWRFQIWQDIFNDMYKEGNLITGYGPVENIPAMNSDQRVGQDGTNTNVHNYIVHILSRGGLLHLLFLTIIYYLLFKKFKSNNLSKDFYIIFIPLIFNSLFDPSMENSHYSVIMYLLMGLVLSNHKMLEKEDI
ncbi:hypothetical protein N9T02_01025 [Candidatus Actinomarina]|nr:hypothetical protein [Candidatus Actinomarina sp.]|tara:strand:- start:397 stop:1731 length:1335 start_codon:yes stop_codon:yes gene_type:complete